MSTHQVASSEVLKDGSRVSIRPLDKNDTELERDFINRLSPQSRRLRFLSSMAAPSESLLKVLTDLDESKAAAFIALTGGPGVQKEIGVARMCAVDDGRAEFAVTVRDDWQHKGLGTLLTKRVIEAARLRGVRTLFSTDLSENQAMQEFAKTLGFESTRNPQDATEVVHTLHLN